MTQHRYTRSLFFRAGAAACAVASVTMLAAAPAGASESPQPIPGTVIADRQAPNILVVLMDDMGFAAASTFGGPIPTPHLDALAAQGLRYNRFHTTAMCSPTRASLLTGRNHHRVEMGAIVNLATGDRGYSSIIPKSAASIGRVLQLNGYATAWFGKNHVTPNWEQTAAGPFDRWPTGLGFDYFYGFMDGASDQFAPVLVENRLTIEPEAKDGYFLDRDLADRAIGWISQQQFAAPDRPFFIYLAPGTGHEPHQAPAEWLARFRGKFDQGWDKAREEIFARQKVQGIIPQDAVLTPRPDIIPAWDSLSPEQQRVAARMMEAHAAQRAAFDAEFGRIVEELKRTGKWENTLVLFIDGDNGASGEGGIDGSILGLLNRPKETLAYQQERIDEIGGPRSAGNYPVGWAFAMNTPFPWFKQIASHLGGTRAGMVASWPGKIKNGGGVRAQYGHVNDIAATIYEAAGIVPPEEVDGVEQLPLDGVSLAYSFTAPEAPSRHRVQYYEMMGNVGIYKDGWLAARVPPNVMWKPDYGKDKSWALFHLDKDYSQSRDVSAANPKKLAELRAELERQQKANGFRMLEAPAYARSDPALRPSRLDGRKAFTLRASDRPIRDNAFPAINNRRWTLTVPVVLKSGQESGTIISQGGYPYGWGLYMFDGKPVFLYRNEPEPFARLEAAGALGPGAHSLEIGMRPLDDKSGGAAMMTLRINGGPVVEHRLDASVRAHWDANGVGIGRDVGKVISDDIVKPFAFSGELGEMTLRFDP